MKIHRMKMELDEGDNLEIEINNKVSVRIFKENNEIRIGGFGWIDNQI